MEPYNLIVSKRVKKYWALLLVMKKLKIISVFLIIFFILVFFFFIKSYSGYTFFDKIAIKNAIKNNDPSFCSKVGGGPVSAFLYYDRTPRNECMRIVAIITEDPFTFCKSKSEYEEFCVLGVAQATTDYKICNLLNDNRGISKDFCYYKTATNKINCDIEEIGSCWGAIKTTVPESGFIICSEIMSDVWKNKCFNSWASYKDDISICDKINNSSEIKECYIDTARTHWINSGYKDFSICSNIEDNLKSDICYLGLITSSSDYTICEMKIKNESVKDECLIETFKSPGSEDFCNINKENEKIQEFCNEFKEYLR